MNFTFQFSTADTQRRHIFDIHMIFICQIRTPPAYKVISQRKWPRPSYEWCIAINYLSRTCRGGFIKRLQCMPLSVIDIFTHSTFLDNFKLFIDSFSQLVDLLLLCDFTDTVFP